MLLSRIVNIALRLCWVNSKSLIHMISRGKLNIKLHVDAIEALLSQFKNLPLLSFKFCLFLILIYCLVLDFLHLRSYVALDLALIIIFQLFQVRQRQWVSQTSQVTQIILYHSRVLRSLLVFIFYVRSPLSILFPLII